MLPALLPLPVSFMDVGRKQKTESETEDFISEAQ